MVETNRLRYRELQPKTSKLTYQQNFSFPYKQWHGYALWCAVQFELALTSSGKPDLNLARPELSKTCGYFGGKTTPKK